jgi:predicted ATP-dependent endonuclease of OLD family
MLLNRFADNHDNCLLIEEPEENIFPETQYNLVKWLVSALNNGYDNMLFITTHSPYILTAMNNLVYAANVGQDNSKVDEIINRGLWIDAKTIAAYYLEEGSSISIMDEELHEIDPKLIDSISDKINNEYDNIRNIKYGI